MATKASSTGILARMAQMIRAPAAAPVDAPDTDLPRGSEAEKKALRERIEAKRRDDMVRKRELGQLRKLMKKKGSDGRLGNGRPSVFQTSSSFRTEDVLLRARTSTLQKIDAIEAHMAESWTRGKHADRRNEQRSRPIPLNTVRLVPTLSEVVKASVRKQEPVDSPVTVPMDELDMDLDFTAMLSVHAPLSSEAPLADSATPTRSETPVQSDLDSTAMQEAAIRFAEGDYAAAAAILLVALEDPEMDPALAESSICALLDVYRAADLPDDFDALAIDYAQRFGQSAPEWYSVSELSASATQALTPAVIGMSVSTWTCPSQLDVDDVTRLAASHTSGTTRHVHWDSLQTLTGLSVKPLSTLFTQWAAQPLALVFSGAEVLNIVLQKATPVGERSVDPAWWHLRLEALRMQGAHEAYENVALDYCMTYEVSPPSWLESNCTYETAQDQTLPVLVDDQPDTEAAALFSEPRIATALELKGKLLTDATPLMNQMLLQVPRGEPMTIQCGRLVRVDFAAAGTLLNWLATHHATGMQVQFVGVPRLVGALFHVMGVTEYASVTLSKK